MRKTGPAANGEAATASVVGAYVRVSSASQSHAMQRGAIETAARARGHEVATWYAEKVSGGRGRPPELLRVLDDAKRGKLSALIVYRLDRLSRRGVRDTLGIVEDLRTYGCKLITIADGFNLEGPAGEVIVAVIAWAAQMERLAIGERIAEARVHVEAKGGRWGRPPRMNEEEIARARGLKAKGKTNRAIAAALGIPVATVSRAVIQKPGRKWGPRALAKGTLRRLKKQGHSVDLRKTRGV